MSTNKKYTCYHITISILYEDDSMRTQHFLRKYSDKEYIELTQEDDDEDSEPDWEAVLQSSIMIPTNGDMDISKEIITEWEFNTLYKKNGGTWVTTED